MSRNFRCQVALATTFIFALLVPFSDGRKLSAQSEDPLTIDAQSYAKEYGVSLNEALTRLKLQPTISQFAQRAERAYGSTFGGIWIQHTPTYVVKIGLVDAVESTGLQTEALNAFDKSLVEFVSMKHAYGQLVKTHGELSAGLGAIEDLRGKWQLGINVPESVVELTLSKKHPDISFA
jgi:hypothetical protein